MLFNRREITEHDNRNAVRFYGMYARNVRIAKSNDHGNEPPPTVGMEIKTDLLGFYSSQVSTRTFRLL